MSNFSARCVDGHTYAAEVLREGGVMVSVNGKPVAVVKADADGRLQIAYHPP